MPEVGWPGSETAQSLFGESEEDVVDLAAFSCGIFYIVIRIPRDGVTLASDYCLSAKQINTILGHEEDLLFGPYFCICAVISSGLFFFISSSIFSSRLGEFFPGVTTEVIGEDELTEGLEAISIDVLSVKEVGAWDSADDSLEW